MTSFLVGSLNLLGDGLNPFEFLPITDAKFMAQYTILASRAVSLEWKDFSTYSDKIPPEMKEVFSTFETHCKDETPWSFFDEKHLKMDNKLMDGRINLLTMAMLEYKGQRLFEIRDWFAAMLVDMAASYVKDPYLYLWDLACNVIATSEREAYHSICADTHLNPKNASDIATKFFGSALNNAEGLPVLLGVQEWPSHGTPNHKSFTAYLEKNRWWLHHLLFHDFDPISLDHVHQLP